MITDNTSNPPAIEVLNLQHTFKNHKALENVSFTVDQGQIHGFVGPNGAGKTTTLKVICTLLPPQVGQVRVLGKDIVQRVKDVRQSIGFMPDHFSMYRQMTVFEYLDFFAAAYGLGMKDRNRVITDVLELTDMDVRRDTLIRGLSRGMSQRVNLARVLINDPKVLLLDEPASGLDPRARIELMQIIRTLQGMGKTIFISSHILSELAELCDSVTIIDRGMIKYTGHMEGLLQHDDVTMRFILKIEELVEGLEDHMEQVEGIESVTQVEGTNEYRIAFHLDQINTNAILSAAIGNGATVVNFRKDEKHLNQAFMDLTTEGVRS